MFTQIYSITILLMKCKLPSPLFSPTSSFYSSSLLIRNKFSTLSTRLLSSTITRGSVWSVVSIKSLLTGCCFELAVTASLMCGVRGEMS